jgi:hypothetical protein
MGFIIGYIITPISIALHCMINMLSDGRVTNQCDVYDIASQRYFQGSSTSMTANYNTGPLDVLYDADAGSLAILNLSTGTRHDIPGLPTAQELVPHFTPNGIQQVPFMMMLYPTPFMYLHLHAC